MSAGDWKDLFAACKNGDLELVKYHIKMGVNPNYQHPEFMTSPLLESIRANQIDIIKYLLANGADPYQKEGFGSDDAFTIAKSTKNKEVLALLKASK
ncbi:MAG: ankyrin repeat domain-containing protein [Bacteroidota bacterium]